MNITKVPCLAIVIKGCQAGIIGEVKFYIGDGFGERDLWEIEFPKPVLLTDGRYQTLTTCPDEYLRPVSGLEDVLLVDTDAPIEGEVPA